MKKLWIILSVLLTLILVIVMIIGVRLTTIKTNGISNSVKNEIKIKQKIVEESNIVKVIFNNKEFDMEESLKAKELINTIDLQQTSINIRKIKNENNYDKLEFVDDQNKKVEFSFYFSGDCQNAAIQVKIGVMVIEANKLCRFLANEKSK